MYLGTDHPKKRVNIGFCNLDIIPNSGTIVIVKYGLIRKKIGIDFAKPFMP